MILKLCEMYSEFWLDDESFLQNESFKRQPHNCMIVFDHFWGVDT